MKESQTSIIQTIITTINTLFSTLFSSIDNNIYSVLDDIIFINNDIIEDNFISNILGTSSTVGLIMICTFIVGYVIGKYDK